LGVSLGDDGFRGIQRYIENDSKKEFPTRIMKTLDFLKILIMLCILHLMQFSV